MTREEMIDTVIKKFGFEDDRTIWFCRVCEYPASPFNDKMVEISFNAIMDGKA